MRACGAIALSLFLAGCGGGASRTSTPARASSTPTSSSAAASATATAATTTSLTTSAATTAARAHRSRPRPSPGALPQTQQLPPAASPGFRREMAALWAGVQTGNVAPALPALFPEAAYAQVKAIADPHADYQARLTGEYRLDLAAAHALLGAHASGARLIGVDVPGAGVHWVTPGACYNRIGYYEVPNSRVVYDEDGQVRSFGIASLISWRGVWYVVHLGAVTRAGTGGVVDDPSSGRGVSAASATC